MSVIFEKTFTREGKKKKYPINVEFFNSAFEVYDTCKRRDITDTSFNDMANHDISESWEGVKSYDEALKYLRNGYQPSVDKLKAGFKVNDPGQKRISFANNIVGGSAVVPLAMQGLPNCMIDTQMKRIKCKVIDIYYDITCSCGTSPETIIKNGQALLEIMLGLEYAGYRFNLYAIQSYTDSHDADMLAVKIKSSNQPLDLKRISFPLTHPAFFRVIGFDWYSKFPKGRYRGGYGHAMTYEFSHDEATKLIKEMFGTNAVYIAGKDIMNNGSSYVEDVLKKAGAKK